MVLKAYVWYDKIDKTYLADSFVCHRSERSVCRGFINQFEHDKKMNIKEYDLYCVGFFDDETGIFKAYDKPSLVDVSQVYAEQTDTHGDVKDE